MSKKNIELEIRAELSKKQFQELLNQLKKEKKLEHQTKRLSVMFWGEISKEVFDIRVRTDSNQNTEIVIKKGNFHSKDRKEFYKKISKDQFTIFVELFSLLGLQSKMTERENFVFDLGNKINLVMVKAKSIYYLELEKISSLKDKNKNYKELKEVASILGVSLIKNKKEFENLCNRLTNESDYKFSGSTKHIDRLRNILKKY